MGDHPAKGLRMRNRVEWWSWNGDVEREVLSIANAWAVFGEAQKKIQRCGRFTMYGTRTWRVHIQIDPPSLRIDPIPYR